MARATSRAGLGTQLPDSRRRSLRERPGSPSSSCAPTRGRRQVGAAPVIAAESHTRDSDRVRRDPIEPFRPSRIHCRTASRRPVKIKRVALRPPSWGGGNRDGIRPLTSPAASLPFSLVQVLPLERLGKSSTWTRKSRAFRYRAGNRNVIFSVSASRKLITPPVGQLDIV